MNLLLLAHPTFNPVAVRIVDSARAAFVNSYKLIEAVNNLHPQKWTAGLKHQFILMNIAQAHSDYQAAIGVVITLWGGRNAPLSTSARSRAGDLSLGGFYSENIMGGTGLTAQSVVDAWTGDAPYLGTMLSTNLTEVGAGVACNGNSCYFTLDATNPAGRRSPTRLRRCHRVSQPSAGQRRRALSVVLPNTPKPDGLRYARCPAR